MLLGSAIGDGSFWHFWVTGGDGSVLYDWKIIAGCVGSLLSFFNASCPWADKVVISIEVVTFERYYQLFSLIFLSN